MTYPIPDLPTLAESVRTHGRALEKKLEKETFLEFRNGLSDKLETIEEAIEDVKATQTFELRWRRQVMLLMGVAAFSSLLSLVITLVFFLLSQDPGGGP